MKPGTEESNKHMKTRNNGKVTSARKSKTVTHKPIVGGYTSRPITGRAAFIHGLQKKKVSPTEALKKAQSRFNVSEKAFKQIWAAA
jgi:hypothetical protein